MGHERLGLLPRRKPWNKIATDIAASVDNFIPHPKKIMAMVLDQVKNRYERLYTDKGVQAAFSFLIALSTSGKEAVSGSLSDIGNLTEKHSSVLELTTELINHVRENSESVEYAELSTRATADTIALWTKTRTQQPSLFGEEETADNVWHSISGSEFCEISRIFFSKLTERYLKYFLERNLTSAAPTLEHRERFDSAISAHLDEVSHHAFETSKITESFAAGWFNKYSAQHRPDDNEIYGFLRVSSSKIREELSRECLDQ